MGVCVCQVGRIIVMCFRCVKSFACVVCVSICLCACVVCVFRLVEALPLSETWVSCPAFDRRAEQLSRTCQTGADLDDPSLPVDILPRPLS